MAETDYGLDTAVSELDDSYLKVLLLVAVRRASSEEPRRAGFWHGLANLLANEQEKRRGAAEFRHEQPVLEDAEREEFEAVLDGLRRDIDTLEAEYRESLGEMAAPGGAPE